MRFRHRAGQHHGLSSAPASIDSLQEKDIESILGIVCSDTSMPSIWGVRLLGTTEHSRQNSFFQRCAPCSAVSTRIDTSS